jgi:hypothetical protein
MQLVGVVAVVVVLEHHLPVPGELAGHRRRQALGVRQVVIGDGVLDGGQARGQGRRLGVEIDEDEAQPDLDLEGRQLDGLLVEVAGALHGRRVHQVAVQRIDPVVIGTDEAAGVAPPLGHQHGAVLAHRRHRLDLVGAVLGHDDRLADDRGGEVVALLLHPVDAAHAQPFVIEQRLLLEVVEGRVGVAGRRQGLGRVDVEHRARQAVEEGVVQMVGRAWGPWRMRSFDRSIRRLGAARPPVLHQRAR